MRSGRFEIHWNLSAFHLGEVRELFLEYAQFLGFRLCFQGFDRELADLPGSYAPPGGRLLLATVDEQSAGCAGLQKLEHEVCEMKRFYVRPSWRGFGLGRALAEIIIDEAAKLGYGKMRLDTVAGEMDNAIRLYRQLGFKEIAPYQPSPIPEALYMELDL